MNAGADAPLSVYLVVGEESGDQRSTLQSVLM